MQKYLSLSPPPKKKGLECSENSIQKYFASFLQGYSVKNLEIVQFFLQNQSFSLFKIIQFQNFLVSKTYMYIYTCKENLHKIECLLTARGEGSRPQRTRPLRMQVFLTCSFRLRLSFIRRYSFKSDKSSSGRRYTLNCYVNMLWMDGWIS